MWNACLPASAHRDCTSGVVAVSSIRRAVSFACLVGVMHMASPSHESARSTRLPSLPFTNTKSSLSRRFSSILLPNRADWQTVLPAACTHRSLQGGWGGVFSPSGVYATRTTTGPMACHAIRHDARQAGDEARRCDALRCDGRKGHIIAWPHVISFPSSHVCLLRALYCLHPEVRFGDTATTSLSHTRRQKRPLVSLVPPETPSLHSPYCCCQLFDDCTPTLLPFYHTINRIRTLWRLRLHPQAQPCSFIKV